jgi:U3 small nucleolar RNA-associated protein 23
MRHLYTAEPKDEAVIEQAKTYERRRCNHHTLENPLTTLECFKSVIDPHNTNVNKHRYIVASQESNVRAHLRRIPGVPLLYINRSVMIMEPMANATEELRENEERGKFRAGLIGKRGMSHTASKRRREEEESNVLAPSTHPADERRAQHGAETPNLLLNQKKRKKGPKGPNPLSVKKPKAREAKLPDSTALSNKDNTKLTINQSTLLDTSSNRTEHGPEEQAKRKRRRKHKSQVTEEHVENIPVETPSEDT